MGTYDIQFSKGSLSVDLHSDSVSEEYSNKLRILPTFQNSPNQASGKKETKILDYLSITHQFIIRAYPVKNATKSAKEQKDDLRSIVNGASINGGVITFTYDGDSYTGYIEKLIVTKESKDSPDTETNQEIKYLCTITFVVGTAI